MKTILSIYNRDDSGLDVIFDEGNGPVACQIYDMEGLQHFTWKEVQAKIKADPTLIDKPLPPPPPPTPAQEIATMEQYLASTDWYAVRFAETGVAIPADVATKRAEARARISELRGLV